MKSLSLQLILLLIGLTLSPLQAASPDEEDWIYTTRPGDTLWILSHKYLNSVHDWKKLKAYNNIPDHKKMPPGKRLRIPVRWLKTQPTPVYVESVTGGSHFTSRKVKDRKLLKAGDRLKLGSVITTGKNSSITLRFADDSRLFVQQNSVVHLDSFSAHKKSGMVDTRIRLQQGRVESRVIPFKNKKSRYEITTPAAVASVRGTQFRVTMTNEDDTMTSEVLTGKVAVSSEGVTQLVPAGFGTKTIKGRAPEPARALLDAPDISSLPKVTHTRPVHFKWKTLKNAVKYHVQIALTDQFKQIIFDEERNTASLKWQQGEKTNYTIRIRGIDQSGLEGKNADHSFSIDAEIPAPKPIFPKNNSFINSSEVAFQWLAHADAQRFRLQVSRSPDFESRIVEVSGEQMHYSSHKTLEPGQYFWRVLNEYAIGVYGEPGQVFSFRVNDENEPLD